MSSPDKPPLFPEKEGFFFYFFAYGCFYGFPIILVLAILYKIIFNK